jgi:hypothetical protein
MGKLLRLSLLPSIALAGLLYISVAKDAGAITIPAASPPVGMSLSSGHASEAGYYYRHRYYPYRYHGMYFSHRYYRYGRWHYY